MTFDRRGALLRKQEVETARLLEFEFRLRARAMRLLAERICEDGDALVARIVREDEARTALIAERGDNRPHPLA